MSNRNVYSFEELSPEKKLELAAYIADNFSQTRAINHSHTAYGLKQRYTRLFVDEELHITSKCFMEAMLDAGFRAEPVPGAKEPDWYFNVQVRKTND